MDQWIDFENIIKQRLKEIREGFLSQLLNFISELFESVWILSRYSLLPHLCHLGGKLKDAL